MRIKLKCYNLNGIYINYELNKRKIINIILFAYNLTEANTIANEWVELCNKNQTNKIQLLSVERVPIPRSYTYVKRQEQYDKQIELLRGNENGKL